MFRFLPLNTYHAPRVDSSSHVKSPQGFPRLLYPDDLHGTWSMLVNHWLFNLSSSALNADEQQDFGSKFFGFACICIQAPWQNKQCHGSPLIRPPFFQVGILLFKWIWFVVSDGMDTFNWKNYGVEATPLRRSELNRQNMSPMKMWSHKTGHLAVVLIMFPPSSSKKQTVKGRIFVSPECQNQHMTILTKTSNACQMDATK